MCPERVYGLGLASRLGFILAAVLLPGLASCRGGPSHEPLVVTTGEYTNSELPAGFGWVAVEAIEPDPRAPEVQVHPEHVARLDDLRSALPLLASHQLSAALAIQAHKLESASAMDAVFAVIEEGLARGLEVRPWLLLSFADGYFPNATNAALFAKHARDLVAQWEARGLTPSTLVVDMEPPRELQEALLSTDLAGTLPRDHVNPARYAEGRRLFAALVDELHAQGWKAQMTTIAPLLADYRDGDDDLRQYFNVVIEGVAWDQVDLQLYRSAFSAQVGALGPHFVYAYVQEAHARFPNADLGFTLGLTHPGPLFLDTPTLEDGDALRQDVSAALAAGADPSRLSVFDLLGILRGAPHCPKVLPCSPEEYEYRENLPETWLEPPAEVPTPPEGSVATDTLSAIFDAIDAALDLAPATQETKP